MIEWDVWRHPVQAAMLLAGILLVSKIKAPWPFKIFGLFVTIQTLYIGFNPNFTTPLIPLVSDYVRIGALHAFIMLTLYSSVLLCSPNLLKEKHILPFYALAFTIDQAWLWISGNVNTGLMTAGSQSAGLLMCLTPWFLTKKRYWPFVILAILAMFKFKSSTAMVCFATILAVYAYFWKRWLGYMLAISAPVGAFILFKTHHMRDSSRLGIWRNYLNFWDHSETYAFGFGLGSWDSFSRFIPFDDGGNGKFAYFIFHNDWLQMLVETGFVGLSLSLLVFAYLVYTARKQRELLASILGFAAMMCFYSPLRFMIGQVFLLFLIEKCWPTPQTTI
jgi:hypothetical protein